MQGSIDIVLIEDNKDDAALALISLSGQNLAKGLLHLRNGDEALKFFYSGAEYNGCKFTSHPKVVLLDLKMPKIDGMEVLKEFKSNPVTRTIPLVVLTSSADVSSIRKCYELGANSYIVKPIVFEKFSKVLIELGLYWTALNAN